jgi:V-type H+-transporting ATPase subunit F
MLTSSHYQDSVTGLLLAGVGHVTAPPDSQKNFLIVDAKTETSVIEAAFDRFTNDRKDIAILLINQHVSSDLFKTICLDTAQRLMRI